MTVQPNVPKNNRRLQIFLFCVLAYLLPFGCIFLMNNTELGKIGISNFILFGIEAASPTIASIVIVLCFEKKSGIKKFFLSNFSPKLKTSRISRGNILIAMIFHMTDNLSINLFLINPKVNGGSSIPYATYVAVTAIFVIGINVTLNHCERKNKAT